MYLSLHVSIDRSICLLYLITASLTLLFIQRSSFNQPHASKSPTRLARLKIKAATTIQVASLGPTSSLRGADRISCVSGGPLKEAIWLVPDELGDVVTGGGTRSSSKMSAAFSDNSLLHSSTVSRMTGNLIESNRIESNLS